MLNVNSLQVFSLNLVEIYLIVNFCGFKTIRNVDYWVNLVKLSQYLAIFALDWCWITIFRKFFIWNLLKFVEIDLIIIFMGSKRRKMLIIELNWLNRLNMWAFSRLIIAEYKLNLSFLFEICWNWLDYQLSWVPNARIGSELVWNGFGGGNKLINYEEKLIGDWTAMKRAEEESTPIHPIRVVENH